VQAASGLTHLRYSGGNHKTIQPQAAQNQFPRFSKHIQKIIFFEYQTRQCRSEVDLLINDNPLSPVILPSRKVVPYIFAERCRITAKHRFLLSIFGYLRKDLL